MPNVFCKGTQIIFIIHVCLRTGTLGLSASTSCHHPMGKNKLNRPIKRTSSVLDSPIDCIEMVGEKRMLDKLISIMTTAWLTGCLL